jgi:hypothetical protein
MRRAFAGLPSLSGLGGVVLSLLLSSGFANAQEAPAPPSPADQTPAAEAPPESATPESATPDESAPENAGASFDANAGGFGEDPFESDQESKFSVNGYIQVQTGVFVSPDKARYTPNGAALNHGGKLGQMSMARATAQLEADWKPWKWMSMHGILRGSRSLTLKADREAQLPNPKRLVVRNVLSSGTFLAKAEWKSKSPGEVATEVRDTFYNEFDLREFFVDIEATSWLSFRAGRQQVAWGETGQFRLLDVVNPVDPTWHFSSLESFEDQRIPLWMLKTNIEIKPLAGNLEVLWIPMLDEGDKLATVPLTFVGAWGLPLPKNVDMGQYRRKVFLYPERNLDNSRVGARWKGEAGPVTYSLVYMYTHVISPPIPKFVYTPFGGGDLEVWLGFPRQHIVGLSLEAAIPSPATLNVKFEAAFEPDRSYPVSSAKKYKRTIKSLADDTPYQDGLVMNKNDVVADFDIPKKKVLSYALTLQRPSNIRWLNPEQSIMLVAQFMHTAILDFDKKDLMVEIPGYDTTVVQPHSFKLIASVFTSYLHGMLTPRIVGVYAFARKDDGELLGQGGLLSVQLGMAFGNNWRLNLALNEFFGPDGYDGLGLFRDRDEVNLSVRYQF